MMTNEFKPVGYNSLSPYLMVENSAQTIEFLKQAFGAEELQRIPNDSGGTMHAEVRIDDTVVMLADLPPGWPRIDAHIHVYVPDVDATYRRAIEAGGAPVQEPVQQNDPDRRAGVLDGGGTTWWIATRVE